MWSLLQQRENYRSQDERNGLKEHKRISDFLVLFEILDNEDHSDLSESLVLKVPSFPAPRSAFLCERGALEFNDHLIHLMGLNGRHLCLKPRELWPV